MNEKSSRNFEPVLLKRRHQVQSSCNGLVTVFVHDQWQVSQLETKAIAWQFSFALEPGNVLVQVERKLQQ
jgi:hypothetical protein